MNERDDAAQTRRDLSPRPFAVDSDAGEPLEPGLENPRSSLLDSGELDQRPDGSLRPPLASEDRSPLELRDPEAEPQRDETAAQADPPTGNLIPPETPEQR